MGSPVTTDIGTPKGKPMGDGYQTLIALSMAPDVSLWEKTVKPPGLDGGDKVDNTTMRNTRVRTYSSRHLITMTPMNATCAFDPRAYEQLLAIVNEEGSITCHLANGGTIDFFGFVKSAEPGDSDEGNQPTIAVVIEPTNVDPSDGSEAVPVYKTATGSAVPLGDGIVS